VPTRRLVFSDPGSVEIHPTPEEEAVRDLSSCREDAREDLLRDTGSGRCCFGDLPEGMDTDTPPLTSLTVTRCSISCR
jgi:hypothetical protein